MQSPTFRKISLAASLVVALAASTAFATDRVASEKNARKGDVAKTYRLMESGKLYRTVGDNTCQITDSVASFKVSQHKADAAMIYFVRQEDPERVWSWEKYEWITVYHSNLYVLNNSTDTEELKKTCPKAIRTKIMGDVVKYNVVSTTDTEIVNVALDGFGNFVGWGNVKPIYKHIGIKDYEMNSCYGVSGKSFSSYVAFLLNDNRTIIKVKGGAAWSDADAPGVYDSIDQFQKDQKVCN